MLVGVTVTNLHGAVLTQQHGGIDFLIAQGNEPGGHRARFDPGYGQDSLPQNKNGCQLHNSSNNSAKKNQACFQSSQQVA